MTNRIFMCLSFFLLLFTSCGGNQDNNEDEETEVYPFNKPKIEATDTLIYPSEKDVNRSL